MHAQKKKELVFRKKRGMKSLIAKEEGEERGGGVAWFIFPLTRPVASDCELVILDVQARVNLLLLIYRWVVVEKISAGVIDLRLQEYHSKFMDLSTEEGRLRDFTSYWGAVFMCAVNDELRERWVFSEGYLFDFRFRVYFGEAHHILRLVKCNASSLANVGLSATDKGPLFRVPWETAHNILCENISLEGGYVRLQTHQFRHWIWNGMLVLHSTILRELRPKIPDIQGEEELLVMEECVPLIDAALGVEAEIQKVRKKRHRERYGGPPGCISDIEDLEHVAKNMFPPCQARHVYEAMVNHRHPKYEARKAYALFTLEAGHDVEEANSSLYQLWNCDQTAKDNRTMFPRGFSKEEYLANVTDVEGINKALNRPSNPIKAYGCWGLEKRAKASGTDCAGCPFVGSYDEKPLLEWMGLSPEQVAEILGVASGADGRVAPGRCSRTFALKNPGAYPIDVKHPNMYYREAGKFQKTIKRVAKNE